MRNNNNFYFKDQVEVISATGEKRGVAAIAMVDIPNRKYVVTSTCDIPPDSFIKYIPQTSKCHYSTLCDLASMFLFSLP